MNILFVGLTGAPYSKRASDTRLLSFAQAFVSENNFVTILNRIAPYKIPVESNVDFQAPNLDIIELISWRSFHNKSIYYLLYVLAYLKEYYWVINKNRINKIDIIHLYSGHFFEFIHYFIISKIIGAKIIYQYVEFRSQINRQGLYHKINGYLCDQFGYIFFDGIITISNFIENHVKRISPNTKTIKIPPICNFNFFDSIKKKDYDEPYILYCGSAGYIDVIRLIINSYTNSVEAKLKYKLKLIVNGNEAQKLNILSYTKNKNIYVEFGFSYIELAKQFVNASALLIPIRNTIQDIARFPNKISEYSASRGVIITTPFGEIPYYFTDKKNALMAQEFSEGALREQLDFLCSMSFEEIDTLKNEAYQTGLKYFNIDAYAKKLNCFILSI